jgi:hypothetical protein
MGTSKLVHLNMRFFEHFMGQHIAVTIPVNYPINSRIYDHLGTYNTGVIRTIHCCVFDTDAMERRLNNSILFCVKSTA